MADLNGFNAQDVEPTTPYEPIPAGKYLCVITTSEMKDTKVGNGSYLELELEIIDGQYKGRKVWDRLNLSNPNSETVKIARGTLSAICRAVNVMQPRDSCELHNKPLLVQIKCKKRADTGEIGNEVSGYKAKGVSSTPATPATTAPATSTAPWLRAS